MDNKKLTFHVLGLPHTKTTKEFIACAYTQKVWKFCKMMGERGHTLYHYGHEESNPPYAENVTVITNKIWEEVYGTHDYKSKLFTYNTQDEAYQTFYKNAIEEIGKRKSKNDFILPFWGSGVRPICDAHPDLITVEPGIGYAAGHWANWKVFESYAIYHAYCGLEAVGTCKQNNYDVIIPNYFDLDEFEFNDKKEDYFLFLGRVYNGKGVNIAIQVTEYLGYKLKIAGQIDSEGPYASKEFPPHVEFVGYADVEKRKELMKNAKGSFLASQYVEPFGGVQIENLLCGTPTITSDWGAFTENNINGVTGYRCRTFDDYLQAAIKINNGEINYKTCREHGEKFSLESIAPKYEKFFQDVLNVYTNKGWYQTEVKKKVKNNITKVLFFGDTSPGAVGIIHRDIKSTIDTNHPDVQFDILPGDKGTDNWNTLFTKSWKEYDTIIVDPSIAKVFDGWCQNRINQKDQLLIKNKLIPVYHAELDTDAKHFQHGWYEDFFTTPIGGINDYIVNQIKDRNKQDVLLPIGVNTERFKPFKTVNKIKKVGFVGSENNPVKEWVKIKRPQLFDDICKKAGVEPIYISGKKHEFKMYEDIDAIICTSKTEGNPMAFLEVVACKIPFISTNVGIVKDYDNVKTFETVDQAVEIINNLNQSPENIEKYTNTLYNDLLPSRDWKNIVKDYWIPHFKKLKSSNFDFIEIGTSDFESLSIETPHKRGLLVEPLKFYLDNLPNNNNQIKANYALSDKNGKIKIFYVKPEDIIKHNLPNWVRGCNSIDKPHPSIKKLLGDNHDNIIQVDTVKCITWEKLIKEFNIKSIDYLKIDTEGHDYIILTEYLKICNSYPNLLASKIVFENNSLSDKGEILDLINKFKALGYNGKKIGGDNYELKAKNINFNYLKENQTEINKKNNILKILYFGDYSNGAMGIITRDMKTTLEINNPEIQFDVLDWGIEKNYEKFYKEKYWENYDAIVIDPYLASVSDSGWPLSEKDRPKFKNKLIPVYHTELDIDSKHFNHGWYENWFTTPIGAINNYILNQIKDKGEKNVLLPIGVNTEKFFPFKTINSIKKIGFIGDNPKDDWKSIKRPEMFYNICKKANIEPVIIKDKENGFKMYEDIDAVICTSTVEGLPTAFTEVVACKIPFISTNVGIIRDYDNVKTFNTVDEAVELINELNQDSENIKKYVNTLYNDILPYREWKNILEKYWIPHFNYLKENQQ